MATYKERGITARRRLAEIDKEKKRDSTSLKAVLERQKKRKRVMREYDEGPAGGRQKRIRGRMSRIEKAAKELRSPTQDALDKMSFKKAFNEKRVNQKAKTFTWRGKKYTTELAKAKPTTKAKPKAKPKAAPPVKRLDKARNKNPELQRLLKESDKTTARRGSKGLLSGPRSTVGMLKIAKKRKRIKELQTPKADYGAMRGGGKVMRKGKYGK
tara:strand:- start:2344 stop:2982 length:639 start_codon:yes stop_codon:yes gene_type:complete